MNQQMRLLPVRVLIYLFTRVRGNTIKERRGNTKKVCSHDRENGETGGIILSLTPTSSYMIQGGSLKNKGHHRWILGNRGEGGSLLVIFFHLFFKKVPGSW